MVAIVFGRDIDRRSFIRGAAVAGLAAGAGGALLRHQDRVADAQSSASTTIDLMNFAITVESMLGACYMTILDAGVLTDADLAVLRPALEHQQGYCDGLREVIKGFGGIPVEEPDYHFEDSEYATREAALQLAWELEEMTVRGWQGQIPTVTDPALIPLVRPIAIGKPAHAAALAMLLGDAGQPFPAAIEPMITLPEALSAMEEYRGG